MPSLYSEYAKLLNSNTGDVLVKSAYGDFMVIKHLIIFKCPKLENDIKNGQLLMKDYSYCVVGQFFANLYCHDTELKHMSPQDRIQLYQLCTKYDAQDVSSGNSFANIITKYIDQHMDDPYSLLQLTQDMQDKTLFNIALKHCKEKWFGTRNQLKKTKDEKTEILRKLEEDLKSFAKENENVSKLSCVLQDFIFNKKIEEEKKEEEEEDEDEECRWKDETSETLTILPPSSHGPKKQKDEPLKSLTTLPTPPVSPKEKEEIKVTELATVSQISYDDQGRTLPRRRRSISAGYKAHLEFVKHIQLSLGLQGGIMLQRLGKYYRDLTKTQFPDITDPVQLAYRSMEVFDKDHKSGKAKKKWEEISKTR